MKTKSIKILVSLFLVYTIMNTLASTVYAEAPAIPLQEVQITNAPVIMRSDIIDWRYKIEDGKMYKRLYNYSKEQWVGDWILCV